MNNSGKPVLAIETTGSVCSVALYKSSSHYLSVSVKMDKAHSKKILGLIDSAFRDYGMTPREISGVCVSEGPGSFTGLRLGFAAAKGIAFGAGVGILKVPTFEALAYEISSFQPNGSKNLILTKAALEESYIYGFEVGGDSDSLGFTETFPLSLTENSKIEKIINEERYDRIFSNIKLNLHSISEKTSPDAFWIAKYAEKKLKFAFDSKIDFVDPYYFKNFVVKAK
ncbi:MAG: tRNA (adenosine(37)-N6)-threonylcarbamoyltransferase complex dimerization subunit type 1 TsaB [Ignavibacteriales bacterium]|nr:tRNA threonylcarbamoyladenosine biosynthesis protein TsaB [Ignavibacteriaceae bacterium]MBW7872308.1 tRNA (adenosine(37)-N6)-threonylcarbamoyltransferase complex dimerization subunit type 1 TsaB [Ignavibacteria bacterium]MBZ0196940.1 tRNA (adenosine(37)-N6)-threonylcarbamoyltransferase complex dimerization subunit type 1 TsaB [Ignavibacteriaceae bacterium]MCZ2142591.1 tRNA (adenosine(37)-N6)-threonylcarbamoyltransferase complex dimerization subunit type 1 TsaB [Ignavibacteriales bacterium]WK